MNFQRYLSAKRTVDEQALKRRVEGRLANELRDRGRGGGGRHVHRHRLRVLEVGAGIGATVERLLARRKERIRDGELAYVAYRLDLLVR